MSSESDILDRLRAAHATGSTPTIDVTALLERGHRTRRRRTMTRWTGGVGVAVAVLAAGMVVAGQPWDASLTPADPSGRPSGDTLRSETAAPTSATSQFVPAVVLGRHPDWPDGITWDEIDTAFVNPDGGTLTVWTGSSTGCPSLPTQVRENATTIDVVVASMWNSERVCHYDLKLEPWVVALPEGSGADEDTPVRVVHDPNPESPAFLPVEIQEFSRGWPAGVAPAEPDGGYEVDLQGRTVTVRSMGSSSCPDEPQGIRADGDLIEIIVGLPESATVRVDGERFVTCTADAVPMTYVLALPDGYAPEGEPTIELLELD